MKARATMRLAFDSPEEAARLAASLAPENQGYLGTRVDGKDIIAEADADAPLALLHTLDDALACLSAGEKAGRVGRP
jgi:hypothetical protein